MAGTPGFIDGRSVLTLLLLLHCACATDSFRDTPGVSHGDSSWRLTARQDPGAVRTTASPPKAQTLPRDDGRRTERGRNHSRRPPPARGMGEGEGPEDTPAEDIGWRDGVGEGRPSAVPMSLDYFQGFLVQAGVPLATLPVDGRTLGPAQALALLPHLLSTPVTLGNFGPRRMAAHLLLEVATGGRAVSREELHARMRRFPRLRVVRPDGYLVKATTGEAVQKMGEGRVAEDGTLRAGNLEIGPFYAVEGDHLFLVDDALEVPRGAGPVASYTPDDGVMSPMAEGAVLAVVDTVEGLFRLVLHPVQTLEGLGQLPGVVRELYSNAPHHWESFRHKPYAERVRTVSRLTTSALLVVGGAGAGAAKAASWGGKLGALSVPLLSVSGDGVLALRLVAVPVGGVIAVSAQALSATYVLHMASTGAQGGGRSGWPPVGGPGQWVEDTSHMSEQARDYQAQVTGAPKGWCYRVCRGNDCVDYDGYDLETNTLIEAKAREYDKWFDAALQPRWKYEGLDGLVGQAKRQVQISGGRRVRWHMAEPRMVDILKAAFKRLKVAGIDVVHTAPAVRP